MIVLNVILIPILGIDGAAITVLIVVFASTLARYLILLRVMQLSPWSVDHLKAVLIGVVVFALFHYLPFPFSPLLNIIVRSLVTVVVFCSAVLLIKASPEAERIVRMVWKKVFK